MGSAHEPSTLVTASALLRLPPELRIDILELALCTDPLRFKGRRLVEPNLAILQACRQLRNEAQPLAPGYLHDSQSIKAVVRDMKFFGLLQFLERRMSAKSRTPLEVRIIVELGKDMPLLQELFEPARFIRAVRFYPCLTEVVMVWEFAVPEDTRWGPFHIDWVARAMSPPYKMSMADQRALLVPLGVARERLMEVLSRRMEAKAARIVAECRSDDARRRMRYFAALELWKGFKMSVRPRR